MDIYKSKEFQSLVHWEDLKNIFHFGEGAFLPACQLQGVAGIYNLLCKNKCAYLADEVGMGKTVQALAVMALLMKQKPNARILVVAPRENLQINWNKEFNKFVSDFYLPEDNLIKDTYLGKPSFEPFYCNDLRQYAHGVQFTSSPLHILRLSSFSRPVFASGTDDFYLKDKYEEAIQKAGLFHYRAKPSSSPDRSEAYYLAFGSSLNGLLKGSCSGQFFDLVIIDEAQYLRNSTQRSRVLLKVLQQNVKRWLFLSATPVHRKQSDVKRLLNDFAEAPDLDWPDDVDDETVAKHLAKFMIRRNRQVSIPGSGDLSKSAYRQLSTIVDDGIPAGTNSINEFAALSMTLVQKKLAYMVEKCHGSYKMGLLSSFETLKDTLTETGDDYYWSEKDRSENLEPPDASFVHRINNSFLNEFGLQLEHPKLEKVAKDLADEAFSTGEKVLVFCRRVNTVQALSSRIEQHYLKHIITECESKWKITIDMVNGINIDELFEADDQYDKNPEIDDTYDAGNGVLAQQFSLALSEKGWLQRFRRKFQNGASLDLFFEENWLKFLARMVNLNFSAFLDRIKNSPVGNAIVSEALIIANNGTKVYRRNFLRYMAFQIVDRMSNVIGMAQDVTSFLREGFSKVFGSDAYIKKVTDNSTNELPSYIDYNGFWEEWATAFSIGQYEQPNFEFNLPKNLDDFYIRYVRMRFIAASLRLSPDTLLDLCCCYSTLQNVSSNTVVDIFAQRFISASIFPTGDNDRAVVFRKVIDGWLGENTKLIAKNCFDEFGNLGNLAKLESYTQIRRLRPVVGIHGSQKDETVLKQFNMPCFPFILIATDIVKEGLNLHLACRRVVHYGAAWTPGDMEQRIGRVDRIDAYFERCSQDGVLKKILINLPYLRGTLEEHQRIQIENSYHKTQKLLNSVSQYKNYDANTIDLEAAHRIHLQTNTLVKDDTDDIKPTFLNVNRYNNVISTDTNDFSLVTSIDSEATIGNIKIGLIELLKKKGFSVNVKPHDRDEVAEVVWQGKNARIVWDRYIKSLGCRTLQVTKTIDPNNLKLSDDTGYSTQLFVEQGTTVVKQSRRFYIGANWSEHQIDFEYYFEDKPVKEATPEVVNNVLSKLKHHLPAIKCCEFSFSSPYLHKFTLKIAKMGEQSRSQQATFYIYQDHLLITSVVSKNDSLVGDERFYNIDKIDIAKVNNWIFEVNKELPIGYLYYRIDSKMMQMCERINYLSLPGELLAKIVYNICLQADQMELILTQEDNP